MIVILVAALCLAAFGAGFVLGAHRPVAAASGVSPSNVNDTLRQIAAQVRTEAQSDADRLAQIAAKFEAEFKDEWEMLRLTPLGHGIETMIAKLKG
jgi:hypothetical protein